MWNNSNNNDGDDINNANNNSDNINNNNRSNNYNNDNNNNNNWCANTSATAADIHEFSILTFNNNIKRIYGVDTFIRESC